MSTSEFDRPTKDTDEFISPRIVCAAIRSIDGKRVITSPKHRDPIMNAQIIASEGGHYWCSAESGFIDQYCNFYTREEAYKVAVKNEQIIRIVDVGIKTQRLYSEMLY